MARLVTIPDFARWLFRHEFIERDSEVKGLRSFMHSGGTYLYVHCRKGLGENAFRRMVPKMRRCGLEQVFRQQFLGAKKMEEAPISDAELLVAGGSLRSAEANRRVYDRREKAREVLRRKDVLPRPPKNGLTVTITGRVKSGRTTLALYLRRTLSGLVGHRNVILSDWEDHTPEAEIRMLHRTGKTLRKKPIILAVEDDTPRKDSWDWLKFITDHNVKLQPVLAWNQTPDYWSASCLRSVLPGQNIVPNGSPLRGKGPSPAAALSNLYRIIKATPSKTYKKWTGRNKGRVI